MVTYIFGIEFKEVWYYVLMASSASWFSICSILFHFFVPFSGLLLRRRKWASLYGKTVILILKCNEKEPFRGFLNHSVRQPTTNMLSLNPSGTVHYHFIDSLVYYYGSLCYIYLSFWKLQFVINNARLLKTKCYGNITISVKRTNAHKDSLKMRNIAYIIASFLRITVTTNMQVAK